MVSCRKTKFISMRKKKHFLTPLIAGGTGISITIDFKRIRIKSHF